MKKNIEEKIQSGNDFLKSELYAEAAKEFRDALEISRKTFGPNAQESIRPLRRLAAAIAPPGDKDQEHLREAIELERSALALAESAFGHNSKKLAPILSSLASLLQDMGGCDEARACLERELEIEDAADRERSYPYATLTSLTNLLIQMELFREAMPYAERILQNEKKISEEGKKSNLKWAYLWMGRCLMGVGQNSEAVDYLERCLSMVDPNANSHAIDEVRSWIVQARQGMAQ